MKMHVMLAAAAVVIVVAAGADRPAAADSAAQNGRARGRAVTNSESGQAQAGEPPMQARLRAMDTDGDGVITRAEWRGSETAFRRQDSNRDGVLSGTEVRVAAPATGAARVGREATLDQLNSRFTRLDADNDGRLARSEWTAAAAAFDAADADHDGSVTRSEFLKTERTQIRDAAPVPKMIADPHENSPGYRAGYDRGLLEGRQAGKEDRSAPAGHWDLEGQRELEQADSGFEPRFGAREDYQVGYRVGFRAGYAEGFGPR
jgi:hypothetical protein